MSRLKNLIYKLKYSDWKDDEYNYGDLKFIWGVIAADNLSSPVANLHTMNDIDIVYDRKRKLYLLGIEMLYYFDSPSDKIEYLDDMLNAFTDFMNENNYDKDSSESKEHLLMCDYMFDGSAKTIEELYIQFRIFVEGYKKIYGD